MRFIDFKESDSEEEGHYFVSVSEKGIICLWVINHAYPIKIFSTGVKIIHGVNCFRDLKTEEFNIILASSDYIFKLDYNYQSKARPLLKEADYVWERICQKVQLISN